MRFGIVVFPGTWSDGDCYHSIKHVLGQDAQYIWYKDQDISSVDCVVLPGGFSYGDYLRPGAIARFSPIMEAIQRFAFQGGLVLGICNGFQMLCESKLLPGVLMRNDHLQFRCEWAHLRVEGTGSPFTSQCRPGQVLRIPISHGEGSYYADDDTLMKMEDSGQIVFRYCSEEGQLTDESNPNGSKKNIAGITNSKGNILGMMPHPERCCEDIMGGSDGRFVFESIVKSFVYKWV